MYLLLISLPLISALILLLFGRFLGYAGASIIACSCISFTLFLSLIAFYEVALVGSSCYLKLATWIYVDFVDVNWGFLFDTLTVVMLVVVTFVSFLVHLYSTEYMEFDPHVIRFLSYLSLFTFFMLILVTADNFIQMFVGWEGVGLCSYLLINFWFGRIQANKAAIKAMLVNRIGDFFLILGVLVLFVVFKSMQYSVIFSSVTQFINLQIIFFNISVPVISLACFFLFLGAMGKSAQLFLHTWLPDAMEGPTPVSALIHAATMVTAGVFLLARCSPIFEYSPSILVLITFLGAITAFFGATVGLLQNDLKRVIAYSTCSQLGYMVFICGLSNYSVAIFHLSNHAFFKALLFLSAGSIIHAIGDEQDMRRMGGLFNILPLSYSMVFIGSLALMGFPFLTGFYSKDIILELAYSSYSISSRFAYWLGTLSAFFTSFYSMRLLFLVFLVDTNLYKQVLLHAHDAPLKMSISLILLAFGSIFVGYLSRDMFVGLGTSFWGNSLFVLPYNLIMIDSEFLNSFIKLIPIFFSFTGAFLSFLFYSSSLSFLNFLKLTSVGLKLYTFLNRKWLFDKIYNDFISRFLLLHSYHLIYKVIDKGFFEKFGPLGIMNIGYYCSLIVTKIQSGFVFHYASMIFIFVLLFLLFIVKTCCQLPFTFCFLLLVILVLYEYFLKIKK